MRRTSLVLALVLGACADVGVNPLPPVETDTARYDSPPIPAVLPVPTPQQLAYQRMETNAFVHFGPNTFEGVEWGDGRTPPAAFAPDRLDADEWAALFRDVGFAGVVLVAKHIDGFLLWPSAHSDYSVAASPWRGGRGDLVAEVSAAARDAGLAFGFYLGPWDRNHPAYGTPAYNDYYVATLEELIGTYGEPFEVWLDGAYGPEVTRAQLDAYDWPRWLDTIRRMAPDAVIALDHDVFWPGNEAGVGPAQNWSVRPDYSRWAPYECDTTVRTQTHWFWHPDDEPRPLDEMVDLYFVSVGRACTLLLNVPPDRRGQIAAEDAARLREWRAALDAIFADDLARRTTTTASSVRPGSGGWGPGAAVDGDPETFWAADGVEASLEVDLGTPQTVNVVELAEPIEYGQRIASFRVEAWSHTGWRTVTRGTTVNYKRLLRFAPTTSQRWRVVVESGRGPAALSQVGLYAALDWASTWADRLD